MSEIERIEEQSRRAIVGGAWHGPALLELLADVDARRALARPIPRAHSIWEIVAHVSAWEDVVRRQLEGEAVDAPHEGDWPEILDTTEAAWRSAVERLGRRNAALRETLAQLPPGRLDEPVAANKSTGYVVAHGQIQHALYHAGQVALLKRG